jgi:hypothetical protein
MTVQQMIDRAIVEKDQAIDRVIAEKIKLLQTCRHSLLPSEIRLTNSMLMLLQNSKLSLKTK